MMEPVAVQVQEHKFSHKRKTLEEWVVLQGTTDICSLQQLNVHSVFDFNLAPVYAEISMSSK